MKDPILQAAITDLIEAPRVNIKGKQYAQVSTRLELFRKYFGFDYGIITEYIPSGHSDIVTVRAQIVDTGSGAVVASGLAQEDKLQGKINATSAMENAETSAIGRALACFGLIGGEYASANEMEKAIAQEERRREPEPRRQQEERYDEMPPKEREFRRAVDEAFPKSPSVSRFDFYVPANNSPEEIDKVFMEIDRISNLPELQAYFSSLEEWRQWLKPHDLEEIKGSFKSRNNQLKGQ